MLDFFMIVYILLCVVLGGYAVSTLYSRQQSIAAMLSLVLLILIFTFYGLRWFSGGALKGTQGKKGAWPPIVNMCPDFMTSMKHTDGNTYCYDVNNTYNLRTFTGSATAPFTGLGNIGGVENSQGLMLRKATGANAAQATRLKDDVGPTFKWPLLKTMDGNLQSIVGLAGGKWFRWEGVWDGRSLTTNAAPLP